eukprot:scaffold1616_cov173-Skeletonema_marinoi.AAC.9
MVWLLILRTVAVEVEKGHRHRRLAKRNGNGAKIKSQTLKQPPHLVLKEYPGTMGYGVGGYPLWYYLIQPVIAGFVGYLTNVLALEMTFRPIEFFGIELFRIKGQPWGFFGWQ